MKIGMRVESNASNDLLAIDSTYKSRLKNCRNRLRPSITQPLMLHDITSLSDKQRLPFAAIHDSRDSWMTKCCIIMIFFEALPEYVAKNIVRKSFERIKLKREKENHKNEI